MHCVIAYVSYSSLSPPCALNSFGTKEPLNSLNQQIILGDAPSFPL